MTEESQTVRYLFLMGYTQSLFRDFESYLRILTDLDCEDIQILSNQYKSKFITNKANPGIYAFKHFSELLSRGFKKDFEIGGRIQPNFEYDEPDSIIKECDSNTLRTKLVVKQEINALRFDKKPFFVLS